MSDPDNSVTPPGPPPPVRHGCLTGLMLLAGLVLLLPGLCTLLLGGSEIGAMLAGRGRMDSSLVMVMFVTFGIGLGGILLIWTALRGPRR